ARCRSDRRRRKRGGVSSAVEAWLALGEEGGPAFAENLGIEARIALVVLLLRQRLRLAEATHELLVPARRERSAVGDSAGGGVGLFRYFVVGYHAAHQSF